MPPSPYVLRLAPVEHATALGPEKRVLDRVRGEMGFVPNMMAHMANAPALLSTFVHGHQSLRDESSFTAAELEVLYLAVSRANGCNYCTAAHSFVAAQHCGVAPEVLAAVRNGTPIPDARLAALHDLAVEMMHTRARPDETSVRASWPRDTRNATCSTSCSPSR